MKLAILFRPGAVLRIGKRSNSNYPPIHESAQRGLCRSAFVIVGFLPTMAVFVLCCLQFLPAFQLWRAQSISSWLSNKLGVDALVATVEPLSPGQYRLTGVRFLHPESRATLGRISSVLVKQSAGCWELDVEEASFDGPYLASTWQLLHDCFLCRPYAYTPITKVNCRKLEVRHLDTDMELSELRVEVFPKPEDTFVMARFASDRSANSNNRCELMMHRFHIEDQLATEWKLDTKSNSLPCEFIRPLIPATAKLGNRASMRGMFAVSQYGNQWKCTLKNAMFNEVDFASLTTQSAHSMVGTGWIWIDQAEVSSRAVQLLSGWIQVDNGRLAISTLQAAEQLLAIELPRTIQANVSSLLFGKLLCRFRLDTSGLAFEGGMQASEKLKGNTLLADAAGTLAVKKNTSLIPIQNVYQLIQSGGPVVTASTQSSGTIERTPVR